MQDPQLNNPASSVDGVADPVELAKQQATASPTPSTGAWAVAVSGGADSVALILMLHAQPDLSLVIAHLDHQTRAGASAEDAGFVRQLADRLNLPCIIAKRDVIERGMSDLPANLSARYRAARLKFFRQVVSEHKLDGVIVAHHADDQAETVLHRLLRGSGWTGLKGMSRQTCIAGLIILRPLLGMRRDELRKWLLSRRHDWREDASNLSDVYARNRLRRLLAAYPDLTPHLCELADACNGLSRWVHDSAATLPESFPIDALASLPYILARQSASQWLINRGADPAELSEAVLSRLIQMAADAATPAAAQFPGNLKVRRRRGNISVAR